jgi:membrane protein
MLYKLLPKSSPSWQGCVVGSSVSSIFFVLSKGSVNFYINGAHNPDIYGTAGLILVLLIWIFVLAAIIYYGASVAYEYDKMKNNLVNR